MSTIAIDARELRSSTGRYIERLIHYLQQIDHEHDYLILLYPKDMDSWEPNNPRFRKVACPHKEFTFDEQIGFRKQLDELKPDLVHFGMIQQPVSYKGLTVTTIHDLTTMRFRNPAKNWLAFTIKQEVYKWVIKRVAKQSAAIITPTHYVKDDVAQYTGVNPDKITVSYEAVDAFDDPAQEMPFFAGKQFIVADGRPRPHKNLRRIIEAFAILHQKYPDLYLMLTGKRNKGDGKFTALIKSLGLEEYAIQTDFIPDGQLKWALQNGKAYIYASLSEGFGLIPLEAMLNGAPVVASNATCLPEVLGDAAQYFNPLDAADMASKLAELLDNPGLQKQLIAKGKEQVKKYSWQRMAEQTLEVYKKVLNEA